MGGKECSGTAWQRGPDWREDAKAWNMEIVAVTWEDESVVRRRASLTPCDILLAAASGYFYNVFPSTSPPLFCPHSFHISQNALVINKWQPPPRNLWYWCEVHLAVSQEQPDQYLSRRDSLLISAFLYSREERDEGDTAVFDEQVCSRMWACEELELWGLLNKTHAVATPQGYWWILMHSCRLSSLLCKSHLKFTWHFTACYWQNIPHAQSQALRAYA